MCVCIVCVFSSLFFFFFFFGGGGGGGGGSYKRQSLRFDLLVENRRRSKKKKISQSVMVSAQQKHIAGRIACVQFTPRQLFLFLSLFLQNIARAMSLDLYYI